MIGGYLLNVKQASEFLGLSIPTLRLWTYQGKISVIKLGRRNLYHPEDLKSFIERHRCIYPDFKRNKIGNIEKKEIDNGR